MARHQRRQRRFKRRWQKRKRSRNRLFFLNQIRSSRHLITATGRLEGLCQTEYKEESNMRFAKGSVIALVIFTIVMGGLFVGCGGGGAQVQQSSATLGQELADLQTAYEKGIITEKEYNRAKKEILRKYK
jgi:hypothetical protein